MSLLTVAQIEGASVEDLVDTSRLLNAYLGHLDRVAVLDAARDVLKAHGVEDRLRITFCVDEWENGYFYSLIEKVADEWGTEIEIPESLLDALNEALEEPMSELAHNGPALGASAECTIDLYHDTVG